MTLRVVSTKLSEEEHNRVLDICRQTDSSLSAFVKECVVDMVEKETQKNNRPIDETINAPEFTVDEVDKKQKDAKIAPKIRYHYF